MKRKRIRTILLAPACLVVAFCLGLTWYILTPPEGFIVGLHPIDGDRTVFLMRANNGTSREWIGVIASSGEVEWNRELPALTYSTYARHGLTVFGEQVTVRVSDLESYSQVLAFDLSTGEPRWAAERVTFQPSEHPLTPHVVAGERPTDDGVHVFSFDHDRSRGRLAALESQTGERSWIHEIPEAHLGRFHSTPSWIICQKDRQWFFIRRSDGEVLRQLRLPLVGDACINESSFVTWDRDGLLSIDLSSPDIPITRRPMTGDGQSVMTCGRYQDLLIFLVRVHGQRVDDAHIEVVAISEEDAEQRWRLSLGPFEPNPIGRTRDSHGPDHHPLRGDLTGFVPIVANNLNTPENKVVVLDLAAGRIAWESRSEDTLLHYHVIRGGEGRHFLTRTGHIVAIDGATGRVTGAITGPSIEHRAFYALGNRLWANTMTYERMDRLPWVLLDARSLQMLARGSEELEITDNMEETQAFLGLSSEWIEQP